MRSKKGDRPRSGAVPVTIQRRVPPRGIPSPARLRSWARAALAGEPGEVTLRIVGHRESRALNRRYRGKDRPTNVLSFRYGPLPQPLSRKRERGALSGLRDRGALGDLVICAPVVIREAREQGKTPAAHWAHMVVHGILHLRGFDHIRKAEARVMESRERAILAGLSFPDPYLLS